MLFRWLCCDPSQSTIHHCYDTRSHAIIINVVLFHNTGDQLPINEFEARKLHSHRRKKVQIIKTKDGTPLWYSQQSTIKMIHQNQKSSLKLCHSYRSTLEHDTVSHRSI